MLDVLGEAPALLPKFIQIFFSLPLIGLYACLISLSTKKSIKFGL